MSTADTRVRLLFVTASRCIRLPPSCRSRAAGTITVARRHQLTWSMTSSMASPYAANCHPSISGPDCTLSCQPLQVLLPACAVAGLSAAGGGEAVQRASAPNLDACPWGCVGLPADPHGEPNSLPAQLHRGPGAQQMGIDSWGGVTCTVSGARWCSCRGECLPIRLAQRAERPESLSRRSLLAPDGEQSPGRCAWGDGHRECEPARRALSCCADLLTGDEDLSSREAPSSWGDRMQKGPPENTQRPFVIGAWSLRGSAPTTRATARQALHARSNSSRLR
jgi:hypothetical protein